MGEEPLCKKKTCTVDNFAHSGRVLATPDVIKLFSIVAVVVVRPAATHQTFLVVYFVY